MATTTTAKKTTAKKAVKKTAGTSMTQDIYSAKGTKAGSITLPETVFGLTWNAPLMHQVVTAMQANARTPVAHTKGRGEVSGGGKKPWRQKGTGRARHGSIRSPIWKGGGVTHGPLNEKNYSQKLNKKMRAKALAIALSQKLRDGEVLFLDSLNFDTPSAKSAKTLLGALGKINGFEALADRRNNAALISLTTSDITTKRSFGNFGNIEVDETRNLNPVDVLKYKFLVITNPQESIKTLETRMAPKGQKETK